MQLTANQQAAQSECDEIASMVEQIFKEEVKDLRDSRKSSNPFEFDVIRNGHNYQFFIKGNRKAGDDYNLNCWKTVPVVSCKHLTFSPDHPITPSIPFLDLRVNYVGMWGSDYAQKKYIEDGTIRKKIREGIETAVYDFTEQETI